MQFGYFTLTDNAPGYGADRRDPAQLLCDVVDEAIAAEELGFNSAWLPEHHFASFGILPTPAQCLTWVAARTSRIKLAAATVLLPCTQPIRTAEEYAVLDVLSNGRVIFSAGRGYDRHEYDGFEIPFEESRTRFDEEMDLVVKCWTEDGFTFHGQHHTIREPITVVPRPVQQPHPPIYVACFSEPTMRMAAERGHNIIFAPFAARMAFGSLEAAVAKFKEMATRAGYPNSKAKCSYFTCLVDTEEEARAARERLHRYITKAAVTVWPDDEATAPPHLRYFVDMVRELQHLRPEDLGERSVILGTPDQVIDHVRRIEAAGIEEIICYFNFGLLPHDQTLRQMQRFSREVLPAFAT